MSTPHKTYYVQVTHGQTLEELGPLTLEELEHLAKIHILTLRSLLLDEDRNTWVPLQDHAPLAKHLFGVQGPHDVPVDVLLADPQKPAVKKPCTLTLGQMAQQYRDKHISDETWVLDPQLNSWVPLKTSPTLYAKLQEALRSPPPPAAAARQAPAPSSAELAPVPHAAAGPVAAQHAPAPTVLPDAPKDDTAHAPDPTPKPDTPTAPLPIARPAPQPPRPARTVPAAMVHTCLAAASGYAAWHLGYLGSKGLSFTHTLDQWGLLAAWVMQPGWLLAFLHTTLGLAWAVPAWFGLRPIYRCTAAVAAGCGLGLYGIWADAPVAPRLLLGLGCMLWLLKLALLGPRWLPRLSGLVCALSSGLLGYAALRQGSLGHLGYLQHLPWALAISSTLAYGYIGWWQQPPGQGPQALPSSRAAL
jgi:hypothetical protein